MLTLLQLVDLRRWWCPLIAALITGAWIQRFGVMWEGHRASTPVEQSLSVVTVLTVALLVTWLLAVLWTELPESIQHPLRLGLVAVGLLTGFVLPFAPVATLSLPISPLMGIALLTLAVFALD